MDIERRRDAGQVSERLVVLVVYEGIQILDVAGPAEVFSSAGMIAGGHRRVLASPSGEAVRTDSGLTIGVDLALSDITEPVDTLLVVGGFGSREAVDDLRLLHEVRRLAKSARRVCSVCTGAFVLAAAGLLRGRTVTTHWAACTDLARRHDDLAVEPNRIFIQDGNVYTSAGVTAGIDLALSLVEEDMGAEVARMIARWLVVFLQRPGGQSQFSARLDAPVVHTSLLRPVVDAIVAEPSADHRMSKLAARAGVSERHLSRLFTEQAGTTAARFVERTRVEAARDLLERGNLPISVIARQCGFGSDETMRRAFLRVLGVGPAGYRARFQTTDSLQEAL